VPLRRLDSPSRNSGFLRRIGYPKSHDHFINAYNSMTDQTKSRNFFILKEGSRTFLFLKTKFINTLERLPLLIAIAFFQSQKTGCNNFTIFISISLVIIDLKLWTSVTVALESFVWRLSNRLTNWYISWKQVVSDIEKTFIVGEMRGYRMILRFLMPLDLGSFHSIRNKISKRILIKQY